MAGAMLLVLAAVGGLCGPLQRPLDRGALIHARDITRESPDQRDDFHAQYQLEPGGAVRSLEILTPLRRAVLETERRAATGQPLPTLEDLQAVFPSDANNLVIRAVVALDPRHRYVTVPDHSILLLRDGERIAPVAVARTVYGPSGATVPPTAVGGGVSIASIEVEAHFQDVSLGSRGCCRLAVIDPAGTALLIRSIPSGLR
jgi:hypothetical protein